MLNGTCKLVLIGTSQCHISDEVGDHAHFALLFLFLHQPDIVRIAFRNCISGLGIESFQCFQRTGGLDVDLVGNRDCHNRVAIEISTRQPLCNLRIDTDCILNRTEIPLAADILVVDSHDGDLKGTCMRITDQCKPGAILIGGTISLCLLDLIDRQDNLRGLARESRRFQGHGRSFDSISKIVEQLLFYRRIIVPHDFIILGFVIRNSKVKLVLDQLFGLLGKELRRDVP